MNPSTLPKALLGVLAFALLTGCGGSDHKRPANSYQGDYRGSASTTGFSPYNFADSTTALAVEVSRSGSISGTVSDNQPASPFFNDPGTFTGRIDSNGNVTNGRVFFPDHGAITFEGSVTPTRNEAGEIVSFAGSFDAVFTPKTTSSNPNPTPQNGTLTLSGNLGGLQ